jgi:DNA-binding PadR family transcriptional regulator
MARQDAQLARNVVLALLVEKPRHGWAIHEELAPTGDIGRAWTLSRQLVYRAIDSLVEDGLVKRAAPKDGGGAERVIISPTAQGKRLSALWLNEPVEHLRDVRTELVVKIMLRQRAGLDIKEFIDNQREAFAPVLSVIEATRPTTPVDMWRAESASAVKRYLTRLQKAAD